jgi:hypothetical protein
MLYHEGGGVPVRSTIKALLASVAVALVAGSLPACSCAHNASRGVNDAGMVTIGALSISPMDVTLDLIQGQPPQTQAFTVTYHGPNGDQDVTGKAQLTLVDPTLGSMSGNVFTVGTTNGGTTSLIASYTPMGSGTLSANATIHVKVHGTFQGPDCMGNCGTFPPDNAPACAATNITPTIVYPNDGVLLPPNMSVVSVMWTPWPGTPPTVKMYEVAFTNANSDVRVTTTCAAQTMDTSGAPSGGCELQLSQAMWDFIAKSNRGGSSVKVTVRATTDGTCATPSANSVNIAFAQEDLNGGIFYWKSTITTGGVGGQIWAKAFGNMIPEEQITGMNNISQGCFGCHTLSRDGKQMLVNFDDADSDDEYGDVGHTLVDVMTKMSIDGRSTIRGGGPAGFQSFNPDHSLYVATNGVGSTPTNIWYEYTTNPIVTGTPPTVTIGNAGERPTMPDWSPDGKSIIYVLPQAVGTWDGTGRKDDDHVFGGSIYTISYDPIAKMFGTPTPLVQSAGENNFYPGYSPDGSYIAFNRVPMQPGGTACVNTTPAGQPGEACPNDSFSNPKTRVFVMPNKQGAGPIDAEKLNGSPASMPVDVSNSWPRWSPFVQQYNGTLLLWITFSSTRDYGLRVLNHKTGMFQCYPADSMEQPGAPHRSNFPTGCQQPQIWMAAINLTAVELGQGDPSFPAFWLPFQDITTHNHTAQWTQSVATQPQPDMGNCIPIGGDCTANPNACCSMNCGPTGTCISPIQ